MIQFDKLDPCEVLGPTEQDRVDTWFDAAMKEPDMRLSLSTGTRHPRIVIPEDDHEGVVIMNKANTGLLKLYHHPENQTTKLGIWTLEDPGATGYYRGITALCMMGVAVDTLAGMPDLVFMGSRVASTNVHGLSFSSRYMKEWGREEGAVYDRSEGWVDWVHFRGRVDMVREIVHGKIDHEYQAEINRERFDDRSCG